MLEINNVSYGYIPGKEILKNISFNIQKGEYIAILGESGCGKSTLLEVIYGLMDLEKGEVFHNNTKLFGPKFNIIPGHSFMKYLAQDFSLMPFTTVAENVGEYLSNIYKDKKNTRVKELLEVVDMSDFAHIKVKNLSGGQKQRVAIAKVLAKEPEILLLDEPFSHIDNFRKNNLRRSLFAYLRQQNITCIVATHDSTDALSFADNLYLLKDHKIIAKGSPEQLYNDPKNKYVASFFNEVSEVPNEVFHIPKEGSSVYYPEQLFIVEKSSISATVTKSYFKGTHYLIEALIKDITLIIKSKKTYDAKSNIYIDFKKHS